MQNFRSLFAPYSAGASSASCARPPPAKKARTFFKVKETWTHDFFCLGSTQDTCVPPCAQKIYLQNAGLGRRKLVFSCRGSAIDVKTKLESVYPKLKASGGFELLRSESPSSKLSLITPPAGGYSVEFLRDAAGLGQALAYIRPLQIDLDTSAVQSTEQQVGGENVLTVKCLECEADVAMATFRQHQAQCNIRSPLESSRRGVLYLDDQGTVADADADEKSVSMLSHIFSEKPKEVIEQAVRRANGSVSLAAQEFLLENKDMPSESASRSSRDPDAPSTSFSDSCFAPATSDEDNTKRIRAYRDEFWNECIVVFKHPQFDFTAAPQNSICWGSGCRCRRVRERIWHTIAQCNILSRSQNFSKGQKKGNCPYIQSYGINSRLFQLAGKMVAYLICHLDIGIPCLSPAAYNYIATAIVAPDCCSVDDIVDLELTELISQVMLLQVLRSYKQVASNEFLGNALITAG
ncbi:hypothetical protein OS493_028762 [Desmophyllum pertusum]|uniref:Uncharacterized protein n=1 Tax=Desmophyllum pertusum TaxID=174260 RepID=A0A9W9Y982_9CNID|nr:hypothetical protein OS493_028762 [Desmophyllum pertusum]